MSTSALQKFASSQLFMYLSHLDIKENTRPDWLITNLGERLELDFYIESLRLAIEVQGQQHYIYSSLFHKSYDEFLALQRRDRTKKELCLYLGIKLVEVSTKDEVLELISSLLIPKLPTDKAKVYRAFKWAQGKLRTSQEQRLYNKYCRDHKNLARKIRELEDSRGSGLPYRVRKLEYFRNLVHQIKQLKRQANKDLSDKIVCLMQDFISQETI